MVWAAKFLGRKRETSIICPWPMTYTPQQAAFPYSLVRGLLGSTFYVFPAIAVFSATLLRISEDIVIAGGETG